MIDITFNVFSDTPKGKDPDSFSPTLRRYHQLLWSKLLPNGKSFELDLDTPKLLHHKSDLGEFFLSSDAIGHTYKNVKKMSHIVDKLQPNELDTFFSLCTTIGAYIIFPSKRLNNKMTINGSRGINHKIQDRFDLTLECIRRFYLKEDSPLTETFERYLSFFNLFQNFKGYVDFFHFQDLVDKKYSTINFWHPFETFNNSPMPNNISEYYLYKTNVMNFVSSRNIRIKDY
tara:strand:- start:96 stop:785 length:690 start_codon:yes stop_codon:yes gene_type:complete